MLGLLLLGLAELVPAGKFDGFGSCAECVEAGFGWSLKKAKCGMFQNHGCPAAAAAAAAEPPVSAARTSFGTFGELPIVGAVPRMKWDSGDPNFATTLARRRTPVVLTDSPASSTWVGFDRWGQPGYLDERIVAPINFAKAYDPNFMYYNKRHGWAEEARRIKVPPGERLGALRTLARPALSRGVASIAAPDAGTLRLLFR